MKTLREALEIGLAIPNELAFLVDRLPRRFRREFSLEAVIHSPVDSPSTRVGFSPATRSRASVSEKPA